MSRLGKGRGFGLFMCCRAGVCDGICLKCGLGAEESVCMDCDSGVCDGICIDGGCVQVWACIVV